MYTHNIDDAIAYFDPTLELYNVAYDKYTTVVVVTAPGAVC